MSAGITSLTSSAVATLDTAFGNDPEQDFNALIDWCVSAYLPDVTDKNGVLAVASVEPDISLSDSESVVEDAHSVMESILRGALMAELYALQNP